MRAMEISGFVTVKDAAKLIKLTNKRVYQLIVENKLDTVQLGREYLVKVKSVEKYLRARDESKVSVKKHSTRNGHKKRKRRAGTNGR